MYVCKVVERVGAHVNIFEGAGGCHLCCVLAAVVG